MSFNTYWYLLSVCLAKEKCATEGKQCGITKDLLINANNTGKM